MSPMAMRGRDGAYFIKLYNNSKVGRRFQLLCCYSLMRNYYTGNDCTNKSYFRDTGKYFRLNANGEKGKDH
jgi:hypothetical protein